jgi:hypothetical protein
MDDAVITTKSAQNGLTAKAYHADGAVLLAFDLDPGLLTSSFQGFSIRCAPPAASGLAPYYLPNRVAFDVPLSNQTPAGQEPSVPSNQAPFQRFRWVFYPHQVVDGLYTYTITVMNKAADGSLQPAQSVSVSTPGTPIQSGPLQIGFTRGFLSSQAYATQFQNKPFEPEPKQFGFDTTPYQDQYQWLGGSARRMMTDFIQECLGDPGVTLDLFAYDLDEPDIIKMFVQMGPRLRAVLDDAPLHTKPGAMEIQATAALQASAGQDHVKVGHFNRFSHSKVLIKKKDGVPVKVLAGSANFSIRGLYVQANNVFIFDSPQMAANYENAFQTAFSNMSGFHQAGISKQWFDLPAVAGQPYSAAFSPHADPGLSISRVASAIQKAQSSVLFAVMELSGGGDVISDLIGLSSGGLSNLPANLFTYGITQSIGGIKLYKPGASNAILTSFTALDNNVPAPFKKEWNGGMGQVIHHKFVVVDFNGPNPMLFTGSSNLSSGGEGDNGDNLVMICDPLIVQAYAVEAIRLVDHYHYRANQARATPDAPIKLNSSTTPGQEWWQPYYDPSNIKCTERALFVK